MGLEWHEGEKLMDRNYIFVWTYPLAENIYLYSLYEKS